jgi:hypothetical protein
MSGQPRDNFHRTSSSPRNNWGYLLGLRLAVNGILCDDDMISIITWVSPSFIMIPLTHNRIPTKRATKRGTKHHSSPKLPPLLKSVEAASRLGLTVILSVTVGAPVILVVVSVVVDTVVSLKVATLLEVVTLSCQRSAQPFAL